MLGTGSQTRVVPVEGKYLAEEHSARHHAQTALATNLSRGASAARNMLTRADTQFDIRATIEAQRHMTSHKHKARQRPWYILHPHSWGVSMWDICTSVALIFTAIVTPFEVSFLPPVTPSGPWTLFICNRVIDTIFIIDMALQFIIMQQVDIKQGAVDLNSYWESRVSHLAAKYMRAWFWIDLFSVAPSSFDIMPLLGDYDSENSEAGKLKVLRVVRTLRLAKLVRLLRSSRVIERWETRIAIPYNLLTVVQMLIMVLYTAHVFACILALQTTFVDPDESWYSAFGYCSFMQAESATDTSAFESEVVAARSTGGGGGGSSAASSGGVTGAGDGLVDDIMLEACNAPYSGLYLQCLYWSLGLVLGFSSTPLPGPHGSLNTDVRFGQFSISEEILFLVLQFLGALLWAVRRLVSISPRSRPPLLCLWFRLCLCLHLCLCLRFHLCLCLRLHLCLCLRCSARHHSIATHLRSTSPLV